MRSKPAGMLMVAAAVAVVLPMAGCGGSQPAAKLSSSGTSTGTSGSPTTAAASPNPTTTASSASTAPTSSSAPAASGLPDLTLPPDVTLQFNLPKTGDPAKDAALQGLVHAEEGEYKATETGATDGPIVADFFINDGARMVGQYLNLKKNNGTTVTGTDIYYNWKFTDATPGRAYRVTYCEDQNKFFDKNRATGQTVPQQPGLAQIITYKVDMILDKDGQWKAGYYYWKSGDTACQAAEGH